MNMLYDSLVNSASGVGDSQWRCRIKRSDVGRQDVLSTVEAVQRSGGFGAWSQRAGRQKKNIFIVSCIQFTLTMQI